MADYVQRFIGEDKLSDTIKQIKKELTDVSKTGSSSMEKIDDKFNRIIKSSAPLKRQLRDLQAIMSKMNLDGLSNTDQFTKIAQKAGEIKDAIADASDATSRFASDTMKLDATIQAFQGIAAAGSVAAGAMALFGSENEDAAKMIQKVQGALAILNGVQQVANILNKDSALMQRIKAIRLAATTKEINLSTVAIGANTIAEKVNSSAIKTNTLVQNGWNVAKAVGKALLGDWTGLLLVGTAGLTAYALATSSSSKEQERMNNTTKEGIDVQNEYSKTSQDTFARLMTSYSQLRTEWNKLKTDQQKNKFLEENKAKFNDLEVSVNNVVDAEKFFNGNTDAVVQAFVRRAKAAAALAKLTEIYRKQMELMDEKSRIEETIATDAAKHGRSARQGDIIKDSSFHDSRYGSVDREGNWRFHEKGAALYSGTDSSTNKQIIKIEQEQANLNKEATSTLKVIADNTSTFTPSKVSTSTRTTPSRVSKPTKKEKGEYDDLFDTKAFKKVFQTVEEEGGKFAEKLNDVLSKKVETEQKTSSFNKAIGNTNNISTLSGKEAKMDFNDNLLEKLQERKNELETFKQVLTDVGATGTEAFEKVSTELNNVGERIVIVTDEQKRLAEVSKIQNDTIEQQKKKAEAYGYYADMLYAASQASTILGDSEEAQIAQSSINVAATLANAVATIAAMNAEAMAKGASSAFALPFPANLAAWAVVASTIGSIFASLPKFADGGIVGGGSMHGDKVLTRLNSGEMVLNKRQQNNLFDALDGGLSTAIGDLTFRLKGADLYGSVKAYSKTIAKTGHITGIK